ncbi:MAG: NAD-dependent epimerase/dehydratase family protein [Bacteroidales bacterium]|nr:MAG: NAD-dependent epimerase/dehydratase family protein [Bacteroidales bacterium]
MKNIAITGSSGFIGTYFIKNNSEFSIKEIDLLTQKVEGLDFIGIDSVLHLAALVHQAKSKNDEEYFRINRDLAFNTAKMAKLQGVRQFVLMSTVKVYGESTNDQMPWNESSNCNPEDAYGQSKYEAERLILALEDDSFRVAIIRSPLVYGAGVKANMYNLIKFVNRFPILPLGGINNKRSLVYIGNLVALISKVIQEQVSGIFIAGDTEPLSTSQICCLIANSLNKRVVFIRMPRILQIVSKSIVPSYYNRLFGSLLVDNGKTNEHLGFSPPFSSEQGIRIMVEWYRDIQK